MSVEAVRRRLESVVVLTWACDVQRRGWASVSLPKRATRPQAAANRLRERGQCRRRVGKRRGGRGRGKVAERTHRRIRGEGFAGYETADEMRDSCTIESTERLHLPARGSVNRI